MGVVLVALSLRATGTEPPWLVILGRTVPLTLVAAGIAQWFAGRTVGSIAATMAGLSWAAVAWGMASVTRSDPLVGVGLLVAPLLVPWLVLLIASLPTPWRPARSMAFAAIAFVGIGLTGVLRALVYEPLLDLHCGPFCGHSPVLVTSNPELAAMLGTAATWTTIIVCGSVGLTVLFGLLRRPNAGSRTNASAILVIGAMAALASAAITGLSRAAAPSPTNVALVAAAQAGACVAVAALLVAFDRLAVRRNLAKVARLLGAHGEPLGVELILRRAIGDSSLRVGYWTDDMGYIGADGLPLGEAAAGRQRTELTSRGRPVAVLIHDTDTLTSDFLDEHIGPQARLAIQNESLQLQLRRQVDELRSSRRRIVEVGEAERRSLERDLHDGAQQLLLALSFELKRGERAAASAGDATSTALFSGARDAATRTLDELRVLAHGIHPGILTGAGLQDALISYAATVTPSPKLTIDLGGRLAEDVEAALYAIVTRLIQAAPGARVSIKRHAETVGVSIEGVYDAPEYVLDRLGAADGSSIASAHGLEFALPCG